jgi:hypothetical protein
MRTFGIVVYILFVLFVYCIVASSPAGPPMDTTYETDMGEAR